MTLDKLRDKVRKWDTQNIGSSVADSYYETMLSKLDYYATREWRVYLPAEHTDFNPSYMERLANWIGNVADEADQKLLLEYALQISFFSQDDFAALYRTALDREITRWVARQIGASLQTNNVDAFQCNINQEIHSHTWFCPVTDSMDINRFHKINHLKGVCHRPHFSSLQMVAQHPLNPNPHTASNWIQYMANPSSSPLTEQRPQLKRLVLLEDIVGSASQCIDAIQWAIQNLGKPVLFVPLILCPNGTIPLRTLEQNSNGLLSIQPVVELCRGDLLGPERQGQQNWKQAPLIENLAHRYSSLASQNMDTFGYKNTGCSLTTFSNTPDNSLPIIHNKPLTGNWEPLFPRVYRD
ncbi:MAG: phosphoribosyltransferase-like protein [Pseudobdellovibrionaceae bacterium]